jgi:hypothetical protein
MMLIVAGLLLLGGVGAIIWGTARYGMRLTGWDVSGMGLVTGAEFAIGAWIPGGFACAVLALLTWRLRKRYGCLLCGIGWPRALVRWHLRHRARRLR